MKTYSLLLFCLAPFLLSVVGSGHAQAKPVTRLGAPSSPQYAYIGGYYGIYEFRVKPDGSLQPLRSAPVKGGAVREGFSLRELLVDPQTSTVYGLSLDNKIYSYAIGKTGRLSLVGAAPFPAEGREQQVVLDSQQHRLYALDGDESLLVYDASRSEHVTRTQAVNEYADLQSLLLDQERRSLVVFQNHPASLSHATGGYQIRYALRPRARHLVGPPTRQPVSSLSSAFVVAGHFLVGGSGHALTVQRLEGDGPLRPISHQSILKVVAANEPSRIVYRRAGSFLYVGTFEGVVNARDTPSDSPIIVCHISSDGHLSGQEQAGRPVPNPRPYLDNTGRFLYVVSMEGPLDAYRVGPDGRLSHSGSRINIPAPTGMAFFGGAAN